MRDSDWLCHYEGDASPLSVRALTAWKAVLRFCERRPVGPWAPPPYGGYETTVVTVREEALPDAPDVRIAVERRRTWEYRFHNPPKERKKR
jgi:hypothetical protein